MQTEIKQQKELPEVTEYTAATTRPPDRVILPVAKEEKAQVVAKPLEVLPQLGNKIGQIHPVEPPPPKPRPQPRVHQRPKQGFD